MYQANPQFKMEIGCKGATYQGPTRARKQKPHLRRKPVKGPGPGPPMSRVGPRRLIGRPGEVGAEAARSLDGRGRALAADVRDRLVWLGPFTHAAARSELCPPLEALGAWSPEARPALLRLRGLVVVDGTKARWEPIWGRGCSQTEYWPNARTRGATLPGVAGCASCEAQQGPRNISACEPYREAGPEGRSEPAA
jgi:hypothetical protein